MKLHDWLNDEQGRAKRLADLFKVTPAAVSQWRVKGAPASYLRAISEFSGGEVTVEDLLADIEQRRSEAEAKAA